MHVLSLPPSHCTLQISCTPAHAHACVPSVQPARARPFNLALAQALAGLRKPAPPRPSLPRRWENFGVRCACMCTAFAAPAAILLLVFFLHVHILVSFLYLYIVARTFGDLGSYHSLQRIGFNPYWHGIARSTARPNGTVNAVRSGANIARHGKGALHGQRVRL